MTDIGQAYASVSWTLPKATDNSNHATVFTIPQRVPHFFGIGETRITYVATDLKNQTANCSFSVEVQGIC